MKHLKNSITFIALITIAISVSSCVDNRRHTVLGQPQAGSVSTKWSQLEKGMNQNKVMSLLGFPIQYEKTLNTMEWRYQFGTVSFEGNSMRINGTNGRLVSWKRK